MSWLLYCCSVLFCFCLWGGVWGGGGWGGGGVMLACVLTPVGGGGWWGYGTQEFFWGTWTLGWEIPVSHPSV